MTEPTIYRLVSSRGYTVYRRYGGPALYESYAAAKRARGQIRGPEGPKIQQLVILANDGLGKPELAWVTVEE